MRPPPPPRAAPATPDAGPNASRRARARPRGHMAAEPGSARAGRGVEGKAGERRGGGGAAGGQGADSAPAPPRPAAASREERGEGCVRGTAGDPTRVWRREGSSAPGAPPPRAGGGGRGTAVQGAPAERAGWVREERVARREEGPQAHSGGARGRADPAGRVPRSPRTQGLGYI